MARITHAQHDLMIAKSKEIAAANPTVKMRPTAAEQAAMTSAETEAYTNMWALNDAAITFSSGISVRAKQMKLALKLIGEG